MALPTIGTTASAANAFLDSAANNNILRSTSSRRYKTAIREVNKEKARDVVRRLRAVVYRSLCAADDPNVDHYGLIAEDVAAVDSSLVSYNPDGTPETVQYDRLAVLLLAAMERV